MKKNLITILFLLCSVLMMFGGVMLYRNLTAEAPDPALTPPPATLSPATPSPAGGTDIIVPGDDKSGSEAEIVPDDSSLESAADFAMMNRGGETVRLSESFGKPIILNFWATWCGPCQMELPHFNEAYLKYQDQIQFMMVDLTDGSSETRDGVIDFVEQQGYQFPLYFDELGEGSLAYGINAIPFTVAINANGRIVDTHLGSMDAQELQALIDKLLEN